MCAGTLIGSGSCTGEQVSDARSWTSLKSSDSCQGVQVAFEGLDIRACGHLVLKALDS